MALHWELVGQAEIPVHDRFTQSMMTVASLLLASLATPPQIFWSSSPVLPGDSALLGTTSEVAAVQLGVNGTGWAPAELLGSTKSGLAVPLPADMPPGASVRVRGPDSSEWSLPHELNMPSPWFLFGDQGATATPGGSVRAIGVNLANPAFPALPTLRLTSESYERTLAASKDGSMTRWHARFELPADLPSGSYEAAVSNGARGEAAGFVPLCTFINETETCLSTLTVAPARAWPSQRFTVAAPQPGYGRSATAAVQAALDRAEAAGGGVVYLPRGQYFVDGALVLPPDTVLRGEARELVSIYFGEGNATTAPDAYVTGAGASFGVEGVTMYVTSYANNVVRFAPHTDGAFLRSSRIRYNSYFCLEPVTGQGSRGRNSAWSTAQGTAVKLAGRNVAVVGNDIYSSGDVVSTLDNGAAGAEYLEVRGNRFWNGGTTHWGISWKQAIYEENDATGVGATAMGSNYPQYEHADGAPHVQNIYHHNNSQTQVWGNDREMMTTDCCGGVYYGHVAPQSTAAPSTALTLASPMTSPQPGGALCVLEGTGAGDCRRLAVGASDSATAVTLAAPFAAPLDASSLVTLVPFQGHIAFVGNRYSDGGAVQLYGQALGCVMADNTFERTGGLAAWARSIDPHGWGTNQRNMLRDNTFVEGNHVYNYATKPNSADDPAASAYFPGGSKTLEPWTIGSLTNDQGMPVEHSAKRANFTGAFNRLIVIAGNVIENNGGIVVRGTSANVLVERNVIRQSDVGIHVNLTTTKGGVVVRANVEPDGVPPNFNPYAPTAEPPVEEVA